MSRRKPLKGGRGAATPSRSPGARRRKGRSGRGLLLLVAALVLFALGALFGERLLQRISTWRMPGAQPVAVAKESHPPAAAKPRPARPRPAVAAAPAPPDGSVEPPVAAPPEPVTPQVRARVAIVIDDLGRDVAAPGKLLDVLARSGNAQLSWAVLPYESRTAEVVELLRRHGAEMLLHLPMDPEGAADPGPGALTTEMSQRELAAATAAALAAVPGALGVNNHMGSRLSADRAAMAAILGEVRREGRYFLDSRTSAASVGFEISRELGIPAAERDLFLDDVAEQSAVAAQFAKLLALARERGAAIAIGHPHPATLSVLREEIPRAMAAGIEFVPVSYLLERSEEFPE
ncbi:MAG: divergent polysaccharide deacetylase family protein [Thermoanaerobaculia bacterium]|nr:divergent polysaccharide deacetylase family protein [Thermoanaerobaculia bacterium]